MNILNYVLYQPLADGKTHYIYLRISRKFRANISVSVYGRCYSNRPSPNVRESIRVYAIILSQYFDNSKYGHGLIPDAAPI